MTLDKQLARCAREYRRLDADRWQLALANGHAFEVAAWRSGDFLLLDADTGLRPAVERLVPLAERARELPAAVKFALRGSSALRLRAEFPLPEEGDAGERIREHLDGMSAAFDRAQQWVSCEPAGAEAACLNAEGDGQAVPGSFSELLKEAGWPYHERQGGALLADLETGGRFLQAEVEFRGAGARFRVTLYRRDGAGVADEQALCLYLFEANAGLRYARAFFAREGAGVAAGFEVRVPSAPTAAEAAHALAALSVAGRQCAREMEVFQDGAVAGIYRSARRSTQEHSKGA